MVFRVFTESFIGHLLNVLCTFNLRPLSTGEDLLEKSSKTMMDLNTKRDFPGRNSQKFKGTLIHIFPNIFRLHIKIMCRRIHIITPFNVWDICTPGIRKHTETTNTNIQKRQNMIKSSLLFKRNKNAEFSGYCFYMNPNI